MLYTRVARSSFQNKQDYIIEINHMKRSEGKHFVNIESGPDGDLDLTPNETDVMIHHLKNASNHARELMQPTVPFTKLLMSATKPNGEKLESLMDSIISDLVIKTDSLKPGTPNRVMITQNNQRIVGLLTQIKLIQEETMKL